MVIINEGLSRAFSISLRYFQLGIQLMLAQFISKIQNLDCSQTLVTIGLPISYILIGINLIAILIYKFKQAFHRNIFFALLAVNVILSGVIMVVGIGGIGETNSCANNKVLHRYAGFQSLITIVISMITLFGELYWAIRYTNAPGNLVWPFLFLGFPWTSKFYGSYITVGVITLLISLVSFIANILPLRGGATPFKSKIINYTWLGALIVMLICQLVVFITYLSNSEASDFFDYVAKKLAQIYLPINFVDAIFWMCGKLTTKYDTGDTVRGHIMQQQPHTLDPNDLDHQQNIGIGTIKR